MPRVLLQILTLILAFGYAAGAAATNKGFYIGGAFGNAQLTDSGELKDLCIDNGIICDTNGDDTSINIFLGYQFGDYFAMEFGYVDTGKMSVSTTVPIPARAFFDVKGPKLSLLPQIPIGKLGAVFGVLGILGGDTRLGAEVPSLAISETESGWSGAIVYGFGGAINLGEQVTLRVQYERYSFDKAFDIAGVSIDAPDVDVVSGAVIIRFNSTPR